VGAQAAQAGARWRRVKKHEAAVSHLRESDPVMRSIIERVGPCMLGSATDRGGPARDHYGALVRAIVGQQLSTSAARSIFARLTDRYGGRTPAPPEVLSDDPEAMRAAAGLSRSKVVFLRDLAERVQSRALVLEDLDALPDEEVAARLIEVKGIGQWTVDMFLIFHLGRPDVLPVGDLGVRRAAMNEYRLRKLPVPSGWWSWPGRGGPGDRSQAGTCGRRCGRCR
jgi:DNA-3-methyladenine glycosylase II